MIESDLNIINNGKIVEARKECRRAVIRADGFERTRGTRFIYEWTVIIEKTCSQFLVVICPSDDFSMNDFSVRNALCLGSSGICYNKDERIEDYCSRFKEGVIITVHFNMNNKTCAFTVNGRRFPEV